MPANVTGPPGGRGARGDAPTTTAPTKGASSVSQGADNKRRRRAVVRTETTRHSALFHGPVRVIAPAIRTVGCPSMYDPKRHAYSVPVKWADDVAVAIETGPYPARIETALGWSG